MMPAIPKYVQVFKRVEIEQILDKDNIEKLIKVFESGGIQIDEAYKIKNPNAKNKFMYVASKTPTIKGSKAKLDPNSNIGYWVYCGEWYIRKIEEKYEFGAYMAYETKARKLIDYWDETKHSGDNK